MANQSINIGATANDGSGDPLRTAFDKINDNFLELYAVSGAGTGNNIAFSGNSVISEDSSGDIILDPNGTGRVIVATAAELRFTDHVDNAIGYVDADGDMQFKSTLTFNGTELVAGSATVSDLTTGRVVYASTSGALVDDADLTFDGSTLTAASITASDITDNRVVIGGTSGLLEDSANLTFNGTTLAVTGILTVDDITVYDNNITTNISNANIVLLPNGTGVVEVRSNLTTSGTITIEGLASLDGGIDVDGVFTVANATGNIATTGTLTVGNILIDDNNITTNISNANIVLLPNGTGVVELDSNIDMNSNKIVNVTDPASAQDAATKAYVDAGNTIADESTDTTCFPLFSTAATGALAPKSGTNLTFNSSTGLLTATLFAGALTGNVTGTASLSTLASTATNVTVADESSDTTCFPLFATAATGNLPPKSGTNLTFNSSTGLLTASAFTTTGAATIGSLTGGTVATEHGAGAIATSFAPITRRYTQNGVIITKIHFDLTGLGVKGTSANDVIGLPTGGGDAYIGRYVTGTYGIVYRAELACLELPAAASGTVTTDIDIATTATGTIAYDGAGGAVKLVNTGGMVAGQELSNITPALTTNHYFYLVEADTAASDGVYNAGQYVLTLYGHAIS